MPISQTTITGSVRKPDNTAARLTGVRFELVGSDYEAGESIAQNRIMADVLTEDGDFTISVWPNDRGSIGGTYYNIQMTFSDGSVIPAIRKAFITYSAGPKTLEDVAFETAAAALVAPMNLMVVTQAQYGSTNPKEPNTVYLVRP